MPGAGTECWYSRAAFRFQETGAGLSAALPSTQPQCSPLTSRYASIYGTRIAVLYGGSAAFCRSSAAVYGGSADLYGGGAQINTMVLMMGGCERVQGTPLPLAYVTHLRVKSAIILRERYPMPGTDVVRADVPHYSHARVDPDALHRDGVGSVPTWICVCYAVSGTGVGYDATHLLGDVWY